MKSVDNNYITEAHHIRPYNKVHQGDDTFLNLIVLCPNCHSRFDDFYFAINPETNIVHCVNPKDELHLTELHMEPGHLFGREYLKYTWEIFSQIKYEQRQRIKILRFQGLGYKQIANETCLSRDTIRGYCKRNGLDGYGKEIFKEYKKTIEKEFVYILCLNSGVELEQNKRGAKKKYCSKSCKMEWDNTHRKEYKFICEYCGKEFKALGTTKRKYCDNTCYTRDRFWRKEDATEVAAKILEFNEGVLKKQRGYTNTQNSLFLRIIIISSPQPMWRPQSCYNAWRLDKIVGLQKLEYKYILT